MTPERRASIRIVTGDGAGWIDSSVAGHRPNAERVLDSFRIVSWMTDALDRVGKRLWCICLMVCVPVCRGVVDRVAGEKLTM